MGPKKVKIDKDRFDELWRKEVDRWVWGAPAPTFTSPEEEVEFRRIVSDIRNVYHV